MPTTEKSNPTKPRKKANFARTGPALFRDCKIVYGQVLIEFNQHCRTVEYRKSTKRTVVPPEIRTSLDTLRILRALKINTCRLGVLSCPLNARKKATQ